jgi:phosphate transport system substrate-binding protein
VYEFTAVGAEMYEAANPGYKVSYQKGGSGAGVASVGVGAVDIGSASRFVKDSEHDKYPDLNKDGMKDYGRNLVEHQVAWDGVAVVVPSANTHGLISINETVLLDIYAFNGGKSGYTLQYLSDGDSSGAIEWDEVPEEVGSTTMCTGSEEVTIYDRAEEGGTEETFTKKVLDISASTLEEYGIEAIHALGNQDLAVAVAGDPDAIGFNAFGIASVSSNGLFALPFGEDDDSPITPSQSTIKDQSYPGTRPLVYITIDDPTGALKKYIDFCLTPEINMAICEGSDYVSIYA